MRTGQNMSFDLVLLPTCSHHISFKLGSRRVPTGTSDLAWSARTTNGETVEQLDDMRKQPTQRQSFAHYLSPTHYPSSSPPRPNVVSPLLALLTDFSKHPSPPKSTSNACPGVQCGSHSIHQHDFGLDWDAIDHQQLYTTSARDETLTSMASNLEQSGCLAGSWKRFLILL